MVNYRNVVGQYLGLVDVMGRQQYASSLLLDLVENAPYSTAGDRVKTPGRLIKKKELCIGRPRHPYAGPLFQSTRQRISRPGAVFCQLPPPSPFLLSLMCLVPR